MPDGKLVAKLKYRKNDSNVEIPVRLLQQTDKVEQSRAPFRGKGSRPTTTTGCFFRVYFEECGLPVTEKKQWIQHTDIEVLRTLVVGMLDKKYEIKWESRLLVQVEEPYTDRSDDTGLEIKWRTVYIATLPDGRQVHRGDVWGGHQIRDGLPQTGETKKGHGREQMRALIPDTEENEAALVSLANRINDVRNKLMDFLSPKKIEHGLAQVAGLFLPNGEE